MEFTKAQLEIIESKLTGAIFLSGSAGTGKSTSGIERINFLVASGIPGNSILLYFPQRTLAGRYQEAITNLSFLGHSLPVAATFGGFARRSLELYWPLISKEAGFTSPERSPVFLTLESSLYFMSRLITPLIVEEGYFSSVTIQRNRLFSQILDNLNKSAIYGFPHTQIADRLQSSWIGDPAQISIFQDAQKSAELFREYCYKNNLLDYSLQVELFVKHLSCHPQVTNNFKNQYKHLIYDNLEEDVPVSHDFIRELLPSFETSLLIHDQDAGYRVFLGASPEGGYQLSNHCSKIISFTRSFTMDQDLGLFNSILSNIIQIRDPPPLQGVPDFKDKFTINFQPHYPQMVSWVAEKIKNLIDRGTSPQDIVILAPYLSDSLRFLLTTELNKLNINSTSHRPSRALRDEPVSLCLLALSTLAHPSWGIRLTIQELSFALMHALDKFDLTRSYLLAKQALQHRVSDSGLIAFDSLSPDIQERITYFAGNRYQDLINWLEEYQELPSQPYDHFLIRLFGEVLSQPGYGFHDDFYKGQITEQIIDSVQKFRHSAGEILDLDHIQLGHEYYLMVKAGVLANQYPKTWIQRSPNAVYLSPAYTFLLSNAPAGYQFWLDVGSRGWYERIFQPLTNPHVLHRDWEIDRPWRDIEEVALTRKTLACLTNGLILRCKKGVFFCLTDTDDRGFEQKGLLIRSLNKVITHLRSLEEIQVQ